MIGESEGTVMIAIVKKRVNRIYQSILLFLLITVVAIFSSTISDVYILVCTIKSVSIMVFITGFWFVGAIVIEATIDVYKKKLQMVQTIQLILLYEILFITLFIPLNIYFSRVQINNYLVAEL